MPVTTVSVASSGSSSTTSGPGVSVPVAAGTTSRQAVDLERLETVYSMMRDDPSGTDLSTPHTLFDR